MAGCSADPKKTAGAAAKGRAGAAGDQLFVAGFQWGPVANFNPFSSNAGWPSGQNSFQLIYESLMRFNLLSGKLEPGLAKSLEDPDDQTIKITLQDGITFSNGDKLTVDDVVTTFELAKRNSGLSYSNVWTYLSSVEADGDTGVVFKLNPKNLNANMVKNTIATTWIVPKSVWDAKEKAGTLQKDTNMQPIGTGPYLVDKVDQTQIVLKRNENYWGKTVYGRCRPRPASSTRSSRATPTGTWRWSRATSTSASSSPRRSG